MRSDKSSDCGATIPALLLVTAAAADVLVVDAVAAEGCFSDTLLRAEALPRRLANMAGRGHDTWPTPQKFDAVSRGARMRAG